MNGFFAEQGVLASKLIGGPFLIAELLALALIAPNTQQLLSYRAGGAGTLTQALLWRPLMGWALMAGIVFGVSLSFIVDHRPTEFLYFQF
jgi:predicted Kef-type K+ transport protein